MSLLAKLRGLLEPLLPAMSGQLDKFLGYPPGIAMEVRRVSEVAPTGERTAIELSVTNNGDRPLIIESAGLRSAGKAAKSGDFFIWSLAAEQLPPGTSRQFRLYRDKVTNPAFHALFDEDWQEHFRYAWVIDARGKRYSSKIPPNVAPR